MVPMLPRTNLNEQVYETLRQRYCVAIQVPGAKLSLHELATELGVSRSPVHHALTRLVSEGLLSVKARRGYYVTPVTPKTVINGTGACVWRCELHGGGVPPSARSMRQSGSIALQTA